MPRIQFKETNSVGDVTLKASVTTSENVTAFLRIYNKLLQKLKGQKYDKITASVCARFNLRCMHIIKNHNTPQIYLETVRTRLLPDYHVANCEVAKDCGRYPFTETFKEILILYTKMELSACPEDAPDKIVKTLMNIFYEIAEFDRHVEDMRCMAIVATIQILLSIDGYQRIKNILLKKLAVKLGSPVLSEIFTTCEGKNVYECKKTIPMNHPDIQKIRKAVEVFNSWFPDFVDSEDDEENDYFEFVPSVKEPCKTETLANVKEELICVKDESPNQVGTMDLTGDTPVVSLTWEVRTDMRKKCNQKAYGLAGSPKSSPARKITQKTKNSEVFCIDDDVEISSSENKKKSGSCSKTKSPVSSQNKNNVQESSSTAEDNMRVATDACDDEIIIVNVDTEPSKHSNQTFSNEIETTDNIILKREVENGRKSPVFKEMEIIVLDEDDERVDIVEKQTELNSNLEVASNHQQEKFSSSNDSGKAFINVIDSVSIDQPVIEEICPILPEIIEKETQICKSSTCNETDHQDKNSCNLNRTGDVSKLSEIESFIVPEKSSDKNRLMEDSTFEEEIIENSIDEAAKDKEITEITLPEEKDVLQAEKLDKIINDCEETTDKTLALDESRKHEQILSVSVESDQILNQEKPSELSSVVETTNKILVETNKQVEENKTVTESLIEEELVPEEQVAAVTSLNVHEEVLETHPPTLEAAAETAIEKNTELAVAEVENITNQQVIFECETKSVTNNLSIETEEGDSQESADTVSSSDQTLLELKLSLQKQQNSNNEKTTENSSKGSSYKEKSRRHSPGKKSRSDSKDSDLERRKDWKDSDRRDNYSSRKRRESDSYTKQKSKEPNTKHNSLEESDRKRSKRKASPDHRQSDKSSYKKERIETSKDRKDSLKYNDNKNNRSNSRLDAESDRKLDKDKKHEKSKLPVTEAVLKSSSNTVLDEFEGFLKSFVDTKREVKKSDSDTIFSDISDGSFDLDSDSEFKIKHEKKINIEKRRINDKGSRRNDKSYQNSSRRAKSYDVSSRQSSPLKPKRSSTVDRAIDVRNKSRSRRDDRKEEEKSSSRNRNKRDNELKSHRRYSRSPPSRRKSIEKSSESFHKKESEEKRKKERLPSRCRSRESNRKSVEKSTSSSFLKTKFEKEIKPHQDESLVTTAEHTETVVPQISVSTVDQTTSNEDAEKETEIVKPQPRRSRRLSAMYSTSPKFEEHVKINENRHITKSDDVIKETFKELNTKEELLTSTEKAEVHEVSVSVKTSDKQQTLDVLHSEDVKENKNQNQSLEIEEHSKTEMIENPAVVLENQHQEKAEISQENTIEMNDSLTASEPQKQLSVFLEENNSSVAHPIEKNIEETWLSSQTIQTTSVLKDASDSFYESGLHILADMADKESVVQPSSLLNQDINQAFTRNHVHQEEKFLSINKRTKHTDSNSSDDSDCGLTIDASTPGRDDDSSRSPHPSSHVEEKPKLYKTTDHSIMSILTKDIKNRSPEQVQKKKQASLYLRQKQQNLAVDLSRKPQNDRPTGYNQNSSIEPLKVRTKAERKEAQILSLDINYSNEIKDVRSISATPRNKKRKGTSPSKRTQVKTQYKDSVISASALTSHLDESIAEIPKKRGRFSSENSTSKSGKAQVKTNNKDKLFKRDNVNKVVEAITACVKTNENVSFQKNGKSEKKIVEESVSRNTTSINSVSKGKNKTKKTKTTEKKQTKTVLPPTPPPVIEKTIISRMPPKKRETRKSFEGISLIQEQLPVDVTTRITSASNVSETDSVTKTPTIKTRVKSTKKPTQSSRRSPRHVHIYGSYEEVENNFEVMSESEEVKTKIDTYNKRKRRKSKSKALPETIENLSENANIRSPDEEHNRLKSETKKAVKKTSYESVPVISDECILAQKKKKIEHKEKQNEFQVELTTINNLAEGIKELTVDKSDDFSVDKRNEVDITIHEENLPVLKETLILTSDHTSTTDQEAAIVPLNFEVSVDKEKKNKSTDENVKEDGNDIVVLDERIETPIEASSKMDKNENGELTENVKEDGKEKSVFAENIETSTVPSNKVDKDENGEMDLDIEKNEKEISVSAEKIETCIDPSSNIDKDESGELAVNVNIERNEKEITVSAENIEACTVASNNVDKNESEELDVNMEKNEKEISVSAEKIVTYIDPSSNTEKDESGELAVNIVTDRKEIAISSEKIELCTDPTNIIDKDENVEMSINIEKIEEEITASVENTEANIDPSSDIVKDKSINIEGNGKEITIFTEEIEARIESSGNIDKDENRELVDAVRNLKINKDKEATTTFEATEINVESFTQVNDQINSEKPSITELNLDRETFITVADSENHKENFINIEKEKSTESAPIVLIETVELNVDTEMEKQSTTTIKEAEVNINKTFDIVKNSGTDINSIISEYKKNDEEPTVSFTNVERVELNTEENEIDINKELDVVKIKSKIITDKEENEKQQTDITERLEVNIAKSKEDKEPVILAETLKANTEGQVKEPNVIVERIPTDVFQMNASVQLIAETVFSIHQEEVKVEKSVGLKVQNEIQSHKETVEKSIVDLSENENTEFNEATPSVTEGIVHSTERKGDDELVKPVDDKTSNNKTVLNITETPLFNSQPEEIIKTKNSANQSLEVLTAIEIIPNSESTKSNEATLTKETDMLNSVNLPFIQTKVPEQNQEDSNNETDISSPPYSEISIPKSIPEDIPLSVSEISASSITSVPSSSSASDLTDLIPDPSTNGIQDFLTSICSELSTAASLKPIDTLATTGTVLFTETGSVLEMDSLCQSGKVPVSLNVSISQQPPVLYEPAVTTVSTSTTMISSSHELVKPSTSSDFVAHDPTGPLEFVNEIDYNSLVLDDVEIPLNNNVKQLDRTEHIEHNHSLGPFMGPSEQKTKASSNDDLTTIPEEKNKIFNKPTVDITEKPQTDLEDNSPTTGTMLFTGGVLDVDSLCQTEKGPATPPPSEPVSFGNEFFAENSQVSCAPNQISNSEPAFPLINPDNVAQKFQLADRKELEDIFLQKPLVDSDETNVPGDFCEPDQYLINTSASFLPSPFENNPESAQEFKKIVLKHYPNTNQSSTNPVEIAKRKIETDEACSGRRKRRKSSADQHCNDEDITNYVIRELLKVNEKTQRSVETSTSDILDVPSSINDIATDYIPLPPSPQPPKLEKYSPIRKLSFEGYSKTTTQINKSPASTQTDSTHTLPKLDCFTPKLSVEDHYKSLRQTNKSPASTQTVFPEGKEDAPQLHKYFESPQRRSSCEDRSKIATQPNKTSAGCSTVTQKKPVQGKKSPRTETIPNIDGYYKRQAGFTRPPTSGKKIKPSPSFDGLGKEIDVFEVASLKFDALKRSDMKKETMETKLNGDLTLRVNNKPHKTYEAHKRPPVRVLNSEIAHSSSADSASIKFDLLKKSTASVSVTAREKKSNEPPVVKIDQKYPPLPSHSVRSDKPQFAPYQVPIHRRTYGTPITDRSSSQRVHNTLYPNPSGKGKPHTESYPIRPKSDYMRNDSKSIHADFFRQKLPRHKHEMQAGGSSSSGSTPGDTSWIEKLGDLKYSLKLPEKVEFSSTSTDKNNTNGKI